MSVRIGIDIVDVEEIERSLARHGDRFLGRVYTEAERAAAADSPRRLAAAFAAKEATMKALGRRDEGIGWRSIEVVGTDRAPAVALSGAAERLSAEHGVTGLTLTLTRSAERAAAVVVAEARP
ncbi:MAG: holo-ACP synthase [Solirubrobacteraceae bacterium]